MYRLIIVIILTILGISSNIEKYIPIAIQFQENTFCVSLTQRMKIRNQPTTEGNTDTGNRVNAGEIIKVIAVNNEWYQIIEGQFVGLYFDSGWSHEVGCPDGSGNTQSEDPVQQSQPVPSSTGSYGSIEVYGEVTIINRPSFIDGNKISILWQILKTKVTPMHTVCTDRPLVMYFGNYRQVHSIYRGSGNMAGFFTYMYWDGANFSDVSGSEYCSNIVNFAAIRADLKHNFVIETIGHEMSHALGAVHGSLSPYYADGVNSSVKGLSDSYYIQREVGKALRGNCGAPASDICFAVAHNAFGY